MSKQHPSFSNGLFFGFAAGLAAMYLVGTKEGRDLKDKLIQQLETAQENSDLQQFTQAPDPQPTSQPEPQYNQSKINQVKQLLSDVTQQLKQYQTQSDDSQDSNQNQPSRHFTKKGKSL